MTLCADSMEEFTSRVALEAKICVKLHTVIKDENCDYFATTIQKDPILKNWTRFTPEEQAYISYFFNRAK